MILVNRPEDLKNIFENKPVLAVDTETTGFCPFQNKLRLIQISNGEETLVIDLFKTNNEAVGEFLRPVLESQDSVKIFHNAKFDIKFLWKQLNIRPERIFDTMLASSIIEAGVKRQKGFHGLEQVAQRYLGVELTKDEQTSDWSGELSKSQLEYAANDVKHLFALREKMIKHLKDYKLTRCAKLEFDAVLPTAWIELSGFYLDLNEWNEVAEGHLAAANEAASKIYQALEPVVEQTNLFGEPAINLNSHVQIQKYFRALGVPMPDSTREFLLTPLAKEYEIVQWLLDYRGHIKAHGTFGESYRQFINPITGRIHANFIQSVAETGRYAVSNPNLNQIPADKAHRNCFKAQEGNTLISNDFSQEELRILADVSNDKKFQDLFASGVDFHTSTAAKIFNMDLDKVTSEERNLAKRCNFGITYCIGPEKLGLSAGIPATEAQLIINNYFQTFKGVKRYMDFQKAQVLRTHYSRSASGRMMRYEFDDGDRKAASQAQRNAVNGPIQATGADILKRSLRLFYDSAKDLTDVVKVVNIVHDEINVEVPDCMVDEIKEKLTTAMVAAGSEFVKNVEIKVDSKVSKKWDKG